MKQVTVTAQNVELAIADGLRQLRAAREMVDVSIIDKGSKGFLGIGSRLAIVKVSFKQERIIEELSKMSFDEKIEKIYEVEEAEEIQATSTTPVIEEELQSKSVESSEDNVEVNYDEVIAVITAYLKQVSSDMGIDIEISHEVDGKFVTFNLSGEKVALLIGKRGKVLNSLQYLAQLVANNQSSRFVMIKLDAEEYRSRRGESLEGLARKTAFQVKRTRKAVSLEPMPSYERKVIHAAISDISGIKTYSEGTDPNRHLVIAPDY